MDIKDNIKTICKARGRTLAQLANDLNITRQTLFRKVTGNTTTDTLKKLADCLNVPPFVLLHPDPARAMEEADGRQDYRTGPADPAPGPAAPTSYPAPVPAVCPVCRSPLIIQIAQDTTQPATDETIQKETTQDQKPRGRKHKRQEEGKQNEMELF